MKGRKPIYDVASLEPGQRLQLVGRAKKFKDQYIHFFKKRAPEFNLRLIVEGRKVFVERPYPKEEIAA